MKYLFHNEMGIYLPAIYLKNDVHSSELNSCLKCQTITSTSAENLD